MLPTRNARVVQGPPQLDRTVHTAGLVVQPDDPGQPAIEPTTTHVQHPAHPHDPKLSVMVTDEGILHRRSLAKYAAAFFKISRSSVTRASSRFTRASSSAAFPCRP